MTKKKIPAIITGKTEEEVIAKLKEFYPEDKYTITRNNCNSVWLERKDGSAKNLLDIEKRTKRDSDKMVVDIYGIDFRSDLEKYEDRRLVTCMNGIRQAGTPPIVPEWY